MTVDTEKMKALALAATPGPWEVQVDEHPHFRGGAHRERRIKTTWEHGQLRGPYPVITTSVGIGAAKDGPPRHMVAMSDEDAEFIAEANPASVLELIAEVERLRAELATRCRAEGGGTSDKSSELSGAAPAAGTDKDAALGTAREALHAMLTQFTRTPSTVGDSIARGTAHAAITAIDAAIGAHTKAGKEEACGS